MNTVVRIPGPSWMANRFKSNMEPLVITVALPVVDFSTPIFPNGDNITEDTEKRLENAGSRPFLSVSGHTDGHAVEFGPWIKLELLFWFLYVEPK